uniref:Kelch-like protein diablo n=1 Tax=Glossina brevipalpis TaxID=37001 RepID=A0A1A9WTP0_9MUSC
MAAKYIDEIKPITEEKYKNSDYGNTFLDALNKMRINKKRCDFSLEVQDEVIHVHKVALEIASPYFAALFESDMQETREEVVRFVDVDSIAVKALVEYMYSGTITLTEDNVEVLFSTSDLFEIDWVKDQCEEFLNRNMNSKNCFRIWELADLHTVKELYDCTYKYILDHFYDLLDGEGLLLLPFDKFQELIKDDKLSVKCEDDVYKAAINWLKHDVEERKVHLPELMNHIRLPLISTQFLRSHVATERLITKDEKCNQLLMEALFYKLTPADEGKGLSDRFRSRKGIVYNNAMFHVFLVGGRSPDNCNTYDNCKIYDISRNKLIEISNMIEERYFNSAIALNGVIYTMGGISFRALKTAEFYDRVNRRWNYIAPMSNRRHSFGICSYNDFVYVVGGYETSTVECYNPATNKWCSCPNIPNEHSSYTRATLLENSIYSLVGGYESSCFRIDPREGQWFKLDVMPDISDSYELVSYDRTLFYIGNESCKRLDIRMNIWESMHFMHTYRNNFSAVIAADNIYVLGGKRLLSSDKSIERYNITNNKWSAIDSIGLEHDCGAAAVINGNF